MKMDYWLAQYVVQNYVCSRCWGRLIAGKAEDWREADVICANAEAGKCNGSGFVTRRYAERRLEESISEYLEVLHNYPNLRPVRTEKEILSELGF